MKKLLCYTLSIFLVLSAAYLPVATVLQSKNNEMQRRAVVAEEENLADVTKTIMSQKTNRLISDLLFITDSLRQSSNRDDYRELKADWIAFANRKKVYDQIRYLNIRGSEVIHINYSLGGSYAVGSEGLRNESRRNYFKETVGLKPNQVYISPLELAVEDGQIQRPIKPLICLAAPYYDEKGTLGGIVILNYYANDILDQVQRVSSSSHGEVYLLNYESYWLYDSADSSREWGFMYADRMDDNFAHDYPAEWKTMEQGSQGNFYTENGLFNFTRVFSQNDVFSNEPGYSLVLGGGDYFIVSRLPADTPSGALFSRNVTQTLLFTARSNGFVFLLLFLLSLALAIFFVMRQKERERIRYFSEYDAMTGIYNRRVGFEKLQQLYQQAKKSGQLMSLCFVDINGLKEVNDHLGHEAGDALILGVVGAIRESIRSGDFLARLGGDEFLIVLSGLDVAGAERVWQRVTERLDTINRTENRPYLISAGHGIEAMGLGAADYIDSVVNSADAKMYEEKRRIKQELRVLRG